MSGRGRKELIAVAAIVVVMVLLHQDTWNWKNPSLVFGILPVGLAWHAGYSILSAGVMALLVRFAWPAEFSNDPGDDR